MSFRWGGEFSPNFSPDTTNRGMSEPVPLPSTITGFLYSITHQVREKVKPQKPDIMEDIKTVGEFNLWGPIILYKGDFYIHFYPGKLRKINNDGHLSSEYVSPISQNKVGIAINYKTKVVKESWLYSQNFVLVNGIIVEVNKEVKEGYYTMGGEGRLVEVKKYDKAIGDWEGDYAAVLSPVILYEREKEVKDVESFLEFRVEDGLVLKDLVDEKTQIRIGMVGLGYNLALGIRRPMYLAIMPGSVIRYTGRKKIGMFKDAGWGSLLKVKVT